MDLELKSKVAFISGSSSGLGLDIARELHLEGCHVIINGRNNNTLNKALETFDGRADAISGDITEYNNCFDIAKKIEEDYGQLNILICNLGNGSSVPPGEEKPNEWERIFNLNFFSTTNLIESTKNLMIKTGGNIVCISSICGSEILGAPLTYSCAKAALNHYVRGISRPLAKKNIRINAVAPGNLLFPGSVWDTKLNDDTVSVNSMLEREVSLSRLGRPEEISKLVVFLSSSVSSFSTGEIYVVDGGQVRS